MSRIIPRAHTRIRRFEFYLSEQSVLNLQEHSVETQNDIVSNEVKLSGSNSAVSYPFHLQKQSLLFLKEQTKSRQ